MNQSIVFSSLIAGTIAVGFAVAELGSDQGFSSQIKVDPSPPDRSGPFGGYSAIVEKVSPSVVGVITTREAAMPASTNPNLERFSEDPRFREFFGKRPEFRREAPRRLPRQQGLGSGVILTADGYILTNNHVVEQADKIRIRLSAGKEHDAEIIATDAQSDLAIIKVDASKLPAATLGDSDGLKQGDLVLAIGSPFGLSHTVTSGIVSATGRDNLNITGYENFIQTDAAINPGNSGGALIDNKGRVIGINTAILSRSGGNVGIGFAIPINMAIKIGQELIENGEIKRGYLGVSLEPLTEELADALGVEASGVVVGEVLSGTPAAKAGIKDGDVIKAVNGEAVADVADVRRLVGSEKPGASVTFKLCRGDKDLELKATVGEMPAELLARGTGRSQSAAPEKGALAGVHLGTLDDAMRGKLELDRDVKGVVVLEVDPASKAAAAGLEAGHVITAVNRKVIETPRMAYTEANTRDGQATLLRVRDGKRKRFLAIGH